MWVVMEGCLEIIPWIRVIAFVTGAWERVHAFWARGLIDESVGLRL